MSLPLEPSVSLPPFITSPIVSPDVAVWINVSLPSSPFKTSAPPFPVIVSFPALPFMMFALESPIKISLKAVPFIFSIETKVSFPNSELTVWAAVVLNLL